MALASTDDAWAKGVRLLKSTRKDPASTTTSPDGLKTTHATSTEVAWAFVISYILAGLLLWSLIYGAGFWNFIANTRLLDLMIRAGIVKFHDAQTGIIEGLPSLKFYVASQDPIDWSLLLVAAGLLFFFMTIKGVQFHQIARAVGIRGTPGDHLRAYIYGRGINRVTPYNLGHVAAASALEGQGASLAQASSAVFIGEMMVVFEIVVFALLGVFYLGWTTWLLQIVWALGILTVAYFFTHRIRRPSLQSEGGIWQAAKNLLQVLSQQPAVIFRLAFLSVVALAFEIAAVAAGSQAFTSENVILGLTVPQIMMALVSGYIARLVRITPGGFGQFEWGFAAALYLGGIGLPEAITVAFIVLTVDLFVTGVYVYSAVSFPSNALGGRVNTSLDRVMSTYRGEEPVPVPATPLRDED